MLGVDLNIIHQFGAVSEETARAMANGALLYSPADLSIAITGIAGPGLETDVITKPVGTVWIAWSGKNVDTLAKHFIFTGNRQEIRIASIIKALEELVKMLS